MNMYGELVMDSVPKKVRKLQTKLKQYPCEMNVDGLPTSSYYCVVAKAICDIF